MTEGALSSDPIQFPRTKTAAAKTAAESEPAGVTGEHTHHGSVHGYTHRIPPRPSFGCRLIYSPESEW